MVHVSAVVTLLAGDNTLTFANVGSGGDGQTLDNVKMEATAPVSDYTTWASLYPGFDLSNPAADADGDGLNNQQEYAFGLDPTKGSSVSPITGGLSATNGQFSYTRRATSGLAYTVEYSTDLSAWNPATLSEPESASTPDSNGVQTVTVKVSNPAVGGKLFVRVQAQ